MVYVKISINIYIYIYIYIYIGNITYVVNSLECNLQITTILTNKLSYRNSVHVFENNIIRFKLNTRVLIVFTH